MGRVVNPASNWKEFPGTSLNQMRLIGKRLVPLIMNRNKIKVAKGCYPKIFVSKNSLLKDMPGTSSIHLQTNHRRQPLSIHNNI